MPGKPGRGQLNALDKVIVVVPRKASPYSLLLGPRLVNKPLDFYAAPNGRLWCFISTPGLPDCVIINPLTLNEYFLKRSEVYGQIGDEMIAALKSGPFCTVTVSPEGDVTSSLIPAKT